MKEAKGKLSFVFFFISNDLFHVWLWLFCLFLIAYFLLKGKFYQQPTPRMSQRTLFTKQSKGQIDSSIDDTLTSSVNASVD
jgi:hypothetical protein